MSTQRERVGENLHRHLDAPGALPDKVGVATRR